MDRVYFYQRRIKCTVRGHHHRIKGRIGLFKKILTVKIFLPIWLSPGNPLRHRGTSTDGLGDSRIGRKIWSILTRHT